MRNYRKYIYSIIDLLGPVGFKRVPLKSFTAYEIVNNLLMAGLASLIVFVCGLLLVHLKYLLSVYIRVAESDVGFGFNSLVVFINMVIVVLLIVLMLMHLLYGFTNLFLDYLHFIKIRGILWFVIQLCFISIIGQVISFLIYLVL